MTEVSSQFSTELCILQDRIDRSTTEIRNLSTEQKALTQQVETQQNKLRSRQERKQRIQNMRRAVKEIRERIPGSWAAKSGGVLPALALGDADADYLAPKEQLQSVEAEADELPDVPTLVAEVNTYNGLLASLSTHLTSLKSRDTELESKYRKLVALCTNVPEDRVESVLGQLVQAVESEPENDVARVKEFLKRVEAVIAK
jgi:regulatory protein SWI6